MAQDPQGDLLSPVSDLQLVRILLADLHDDLQGKVARFRQLNDLSVDLGRYGTMLPGGEIALAAWTEARTSFIHGNYVATVMLCQALAEHMLAAELTMGLDSESLPKKVTFYETLNRCITRKIIPEAHAEDLRRLMKIRNPLTHFQDINDVASLSRRVLESRKTAQWHLLNDASFAMSVVVRLLALPNFRVDS